MNRFVGINALNALILNIKMKFAERQHIHEISDVNGLQRKFDELAIPPDIETSEDVVRKINQLSLAIYDLNNIVDALTPAVGEIYITISDENPSVRFGGTWEQIKDTFLLASGDIYSVGSIGGEATHVLTLDEMPSHTHMYKRHAFDRNDNDPTTGEDVYGANNKTLDAHEGTTGSSGGGQPHNNMPPYIAVYIWKRVS